MNTKRLGKKKQTRTNMVAAGILVVFIVVFVGMLAYLTYPTGGTADSKKTYFEELSFNLDPHKLWRVGVPVSIQGTLNVTLTSNNSVRVYARLEGGAYLLDKVASGSQQFIIQVDPSMGMIEVGVVNLENAPVTVSGLSCVLTY